MKIHDFKLMKQKRNKISMLTCYDYPSACIIAESDIDCVLVGDSVAMAVHGYNTTIMATIEMMVLHTQAVARGLNKQFLISDLPFLSHKMSRAHTVDHARQLLQAGAHGVKIEGADKDTLETIEFLVAAGVPVMGHIGLTPQSVHQLGGHKVQGKTQEQAERLVNNAKQLEKAGCFSLVIECVPPLVAEMITQSTALPTIGIGAGSQTDGQVLVWHDVLGLSPSFNPKFVKQYAQGKELFLNALNMYVLQVQEVHFPAVEHAF